MTTAIILQARMGSTRLPGKVLLSIEGKTVLEHMLARLASVNGIDCLVVATTINPIDLPIVSLADALGVSCFRGEEEDVLSRFYHAAMEANASCVVRCNADCPLIDPQIVEHVVSTFLTNSERFDYVSNILSPTYPTGMHCEAFSFESLRQAYTCAVDPLEREHVTPYIYRRPNLFRLHNVALSCDLSAHRWTLDLLEDFELITKIYKELYKDNPLFDMQSIIRLLEKNPDWSNINGHIIKSATV